MTDRVTALPTTADRWRPTRAGLIGLWRYWDETFTFHRGRLLLRGPNGSGKSMALELLLPLLLEADTSPGRLSSAAKSRGGLYDRVMTGAEHPSRSGFAWVELIRGAETFTVGARFRASQSTRKVDVDFFTTTRRVGHDLQLLDERRAPLSRQALVEALGDQGRVHATAEEHRTAVRETLYPGFGPDRFRSVIGALLVLRKEKLSQNLDLAKLSQVLSESLPPLDEHDIAAVAEGFERLDRRRSELAALEAELAEVRRLARYERDYARAVVVGAAGDVRAAETRRDDVTRAERRAQDALEEARDRADTVAAERDGLGDRAGTIEVELSALKDSHAYREGAQLADLRRHAADLAKAATQAREQLDRSERARQQARRDHEEAAARHDQAAADLARAERELRSTAATAGGEGPIGEAGELEDPDDGERLVTAWVNSRRDATHEVAAALDRYDQAVAQRNWRDEQVAEDEQTLAAREREHAEAEAAATAAIDDYGEAVLTWAAGATALDADRVRGALPDPPEDPRVVTAAIDGLARAVATEHALAAQEVGARRTAAEAHRADLATERDRLVEGELAEPDGPPWRSDREGRAGAPLWRLVDVAPAVAPERVDGLEAALAGAGLLDAWVTPDGRVALDAERADVDLGTRPRHGATLADLLVPAPPEPDAAAIADAIDPANHPVGPSHQVPTDVVAAVLASVAVADTTLSVGATTDAETEVVVATDGTYRLGAAAGRGPKRRAQLLGAVARERHRLARVAELDTALETVEAHLDGLDSERAGLDRRSAAMQAELAELPGGAAVETTARALDRAVTRLGDAQARLEASRQARRAAEDTVRAALRALTTLAARHALPADRDGLAQVQTALANLELAARTWTRRRRDLGAAERDLRRAGDRANDADLGVTRDGEAAAGAERDARRAAERVEALESAIGAAYAEVLDRIAALEQERSENQERRLQLGQEATALDRQVGKLESELETASTTRAAADTARDQAHRRFVAALDALGTDAAIAAPDALDTASAVLAAARTVAADHEGVDTGARAVEQASDRVRERIHTAQATLGGRVDLERELAEEGWWVLRTTAGGIRRPTADLAEALAAELAEGRAELAAEEEQLFEQTLAGSVRRALADRIRQANALVDGINEQLDAVRTAAGGVAVRLRWEVDPEQLDVVKAARALLLRDPADLTDSERESLQSFVRTRVDQARAELEASAPWEARLRESLDYRAWHRFTLQLAHRDWEGFQPATTRRLQRLSTGERSIALHLPMIASVAAHYATEDGTPSPCPRLILLDELFAGVDTANRAQLFGTFTTWQLDAVFTSDHEWCQYASLDGIAIHNLHPPTDDEPVTTTRFTWDGRDRRIDPTAA